MLETLFKRTKNGSVQSWKVVVENNTFYTIEGLVGGKLSTSLPTVCNCLNIGKANETTEEQQAQKEAEAKFKKKQENGYTPNIDDIDMVAENHFFEPMLCKTYEETDKVDSNGKIVKKTVIDFSGRIFSQPKLDGIRCVCKKEGMFSRQGKPIVSAPHIFEALKPLFEKNPDLIFDGELYTNKYKNDFNAIISLCKKSKPTQADLEASAKSIEYWVYDLPSCEEVFWRRNEMLNAELECLASCVSCIKIVDTIEVHGQEQLDALYGKYVGEEGYEGQIIRYNEKYENKRTKSILKRKTFTDAEFLIIGMEEGKGNRSQTIGNIWCRDAEGKEFKAGVKGNFERLRKLWQDREQLIGKMATIKYFNLTPDAGVPRFGVMKAVRDYE